MCENILHKKNSTAPEKQSKQFKETLKTTVPDQQISLNH